MKKFALATIIVGLFILYSLIYNHTNFTAVVPSNTTVSGSSTNRGSSNAGSTGNPTVTNTTGASYKDGSYTGSVADAQWGYIQVKAIIQNGKITDVQFLQYPNERTRSVEINNYADPQLTSEAIQAQSANVDIITGATDTSEAFVQSLSDALAQAKG